MFELGCVAKMVFCDFSTFTASWTKFWIFFSSWRILMEKYPNKSTNWAAFRPWYGKAGHKLHKMSTIKAWTWGWEFFCKVTMSEWACHRTLEVLHSSRNFSMNRLMRALLKCLPKFWISLKLKASLEFWPSGSSEEDRGPFGLLMGLKALFRDELDCVEAPVPESQVSNINSDIGSLLGQYWPWESVHDNETCINLTSRPTLILEVSKLVEVRLIQVSLSWTLS